MTTDGATRPCPFCGGQILEKALQCRHCKKWLQEPDRSRPASFGPRPSGPYSPAQPTKHLVLLAIFTLGLYELYWFWRNWRDLRDHFSLDLSPGWRTLGLLLPFVNLFMIYHQLRLVAEVAERRGVAPAYSPMTMTVLFVGLTLVGNVTLLWPVSLLNVLALVPVQETLNRVWTAQYEDRPMREEFLPQELGVLIAGGLFTAMTLAAALG